MNSQVVPIGEASTAIITSAEPLTATEIKARVQRIQQVMRAVMKETVHYGKIPGAGERKSLFKPGAEVLGATFRVAPSYRVEDLSDDDRYRYRVTCVGTHQVTNMVLGEGMGAASSSEEKYKWRNAVCDEEWEDTPEDRRRTKWQKGGWDNGQQRAPYKRFQVRTEPDDIDNTVLKMACKRAQVAMIINVTGASDIFAQDLEDLPEGYADQLDRRADSEHADQGQGQRRNGNGSGRNTKPSTQAPHARSGGGKVNEKMSRLLFIRLEEHGVAAKDFCAHFKLEQVADLPFDRMNEGLKWISDNNSGDQDEAGARG